MADREVKTKLILEGEPGGMVAAVNASHESLNGLTGATQQATSQLTGMAGAIPIVAAALASLKLAEFAQSAVMLAARVETLGVVMRVVGNNAGYSGDQMERYAQGVASMGITTEVSRQSVIKMASAHMDLNHASELARIAQDAAVIGNINSSEAFDKMVHGIQAAQVDVLRTIGINVNFEESYKRIALQLGKASAELTEHEKIQARTAVVLDKGKDIAGAYSASMDTAGKIINSMKRPAEEISLSLGQIFTPSLNMLAKDFYTELSKVSKELKDGQPTIDAWGNKTLEVTMAVKAEFMRLAMLVDKLGGTLTSLESKSFTVMGVVTRAMTLGQFGGGLENRAAGMKEANDLYASRYAATEAELIKLAEKYNQIGVAPAKAAENIRKQADQPGGTGKKKDDTNTWQASHENYLQYEQAYNARHLAISKAGMDAIQYQNEQGYAQGIVSLQQYLDTKQKAVIGQMEQERAAALANLDQRQQDLVAKAKIVDAKPGDAEAAKDYHAALKKAEEANTALINVESKLHIQRLKNSDEYQAAIRNETIENAAAMSHWRAVAEREHEDDLDKTAEFLAMQAQLRGSSSEMEILRIEREERAWIQSWAKLADSYEEYEIRKQMVEAVSAQKKVLVTNGEFGQKLQIASAGTQALMNFTNALYTFSGKKSREMFILNKVAGVANAVVNTALAATQALAAPPGPPWSFAYVAAAVAAGMAQIATITSTSFEGGGSPAAAGGYSGGTPDSPVVTQPVQSSNVQPMQVTFAPVFHGPVDQQALNKYTEDYLIPTFRDLATRGITIVPK